MLKIYAGNLPPDLAEKEVHRFIRQARAGALDRSGSLHLQRPVPRLHRNEGPRGPDRDQCLERAHRARQQSSCQRRASPVGETAAEASLTTDRLD